MLKDQPDIRIALHDRISQNKRISGALILLFMAPYLASAGFCYWYFPWKWMLIPILVAGMFRYWHPFWHGDRMIISRLGARPMTRDESISCLNIVEGLSIAAGILCPNLYVLESATPNAISAGRDPKHAVLCVTRGLIDIMDRAELEGVISHEIAHIACRDTRVSTFLATVLSAADRTRAEGKPDVWTSIQEHWRSVLLGVVGSLSAIVVLMFHLHVDTTYIIMLVGFVALMFLILWTITGLVPFILEMLQAAVLRRMEFLADATSVLFTRYPDGLARALTKISSHVGAPVMSVGPISNLFIAAPFSSAGPKHRHRVAIQPPIEERLRRLRNM
jgi:heat shock protein HtpX